MAHGPRYTVKYRRRREGKTDYRKRLKLLKSRLPRLVVRRGIWNFTVQLIEYNENGDKTIFTIHSKHLYKK
ncbi:MAG: 50S ribosomal protein L18, partial [Nanopusillaceae archaeon]